MASVIGSRNVYLLCEFENVFWAPLWSRTVEVPSKEERPADGNEDQKELRPPLHAVAAFHS